MIIRKYGVDCFGLDNDRLDVYWEFVDGSKAPDYEVWVERAGSISGPFSVIAKTYCASIYTDRQQDYDDAQYFFYRLRVVKRSSSDTVQLTEALTFEAEADLVTLELRRRHNLLLREYTGNPVLYYPVRSTGLRCPECWSELAKQRTKSGCKSCFDTGFVTGFYTPILMFLNIHENQAELEQNAEVDEEVNRSATAYIVGNFPLSFGDMIVEKTNDRWLVSAWNKTEKLRARSGFNVRLHFVSEDDVKYSVPLPDLNILKTAYRNREYSRPYTLNP